MPWIFHLLKNVSLMQFLSLDRLWALLRTHRWHPSFCSNGHLSSRKPCLDVDVLTEQSTSNLSLLSKYLLVMITLLPAVLSGVIKRNATFSRNWGPETLTDMHKTTDPEGFYKREATVSCHFPFCCPWQIHLLFVQLFTRVNRYSSAHPGDVRVVETKPANRKN